MASKTAINVQTPKGELQWVFASGEGKENKNGVKKYQASVVVPDEQAKPFCDQIDAFWKENKPKGAKQPNTCGYRPHTVASDEKDEDGDTVYVEVPGFTEFFMSTNAAWPDGKPRKINIFNAKNQPVALTKKIGNGSIGRLAGVMDIYDVSNNTGVNLYFSAIKLLKLEEYQDGPSFADDDDDAEYEDAFMGDEDSEFTGEETEPTSKPRL